MVIRKANPVVLHYYYEFQLQGQLRIENAKLRISPDSKSFFPDRFPCYSAFSL